MLSKELRKDVHFSTKFQRVTPEFSTLVDGKTEVVVRVENSENEYFNLWSVDKF